MTSPKRSSTRQYSLGNVISLTSVSAFYLAFNRYHGWSLELLVLSFFPAQLILLHWVTRGRIIMGCLGGVLVHFVVWGIPSLGPDPMSLASLIVELASICFFAIAGMSIHAISIGSYFVGFVSIAVAVPCYLVLLRLAYMN